MKTRPAIGSRWVTGGKNDCEKVAGSMAHRDTPLPAKVPAAKSEAVSRVTIVFDNKCFVSACSYATPETSLGGFSICGGQHEATKTTWLSPLNILKIVN
ncbi:MAG: hypothetical protein WKF77_13100 [Planctomycetaceae bacterium]